MWIDVDLKACTDAFAKLIEIFKKVLEKSDADTACCSVIFVENREAAVKFAVEAGAPAAGLFFCDFHSELSDFIRKSTGFRLFLHLPTVVLWDFAKSQCISTDGVAALREGRLQADTFPDWRTNCYRALASDVIPAGSAYVTDSEALHSCGLYAGDVARLNVLTGKEAVYCYINPPEAADSEAVESEVVAHYDEADVILLSPQDYQLLTAGCDPADSVVTICLSVCHDVPDATQVTFSTSSASTLPDNDIVCRWLDPYYGVGTALSSRSALVSATLQGLSSGGAGGGSNMSSWMSDYLVSASCPYRLAWRGQKLSLSDHPTVASDSQGFLDLSVVEVMPDDMVVRVGPTTLLQLQHVAK